MKSKNTFQTYVFGNHFQTLNSSLSNEKTSSRPVAPCLFPLHRRRDEPHHLAVDYVPAENSGSHTRYAVDAGFLTPVFVIPAENLPNTRFSDDAKKPSLGRFPAGMTKERMTKKTAYPTTFPGFKIPRGSNARLICRIRRISVLEKTMSR